MKYVLENLDWTIIQNMLLSIVPALLCITIHECAHGFAANLMGDPTAKLMGRITLNPLKHLDLIGLVMIVIFGFGWAKPVPINMRLFKNPKRGMAISALAGPLSNVILAAVIMLFTGVILAFWHSGTSVFIIENILLRTAYLSCALAVFNLLPIPPLDGSKVAFSFLPDGIYENLMKYERYGFIVLILIVNTGIFDSTIGTVTMRLYEMLNWVAIHTYRLLA